MRDLVPASDLSILFIMHATKDANEFASKNAISRKAHEEVLIHNSKLKAEITKRTAVPKVLPSHSGSVTRAFFSSGIDGFPGPLWKVIYGDCKAVLDKSTLLDLPHCHTEESGNHTPGEETTIALISVDSIGREDSNSRDNEPSPPPYPRQPCTILPVFHAMSTPGTAPESNSDTSSSPSSSRPSRHSQNILDLSDTHSPRVLGNPNTSSLPATDERRFGTEASANAGELAASEHLDSTGGDNTVPELGGDVLDVGGEGTVGRESNGAYANESKVKWHFSSQDTSAPCIS